MLKSFGEGIWISDIELKFYGIELGSRMTVVKLDSDRSLFIHSPVRLNAELLEAINKLGVVKYVIAPNRWHHLFVSDFKIEFPSAQFFCAGGLEKKRPDFHFDAIILGDKQYPWSSAIEHRQIKGAPFFNEVVFYHSKSKTLVTTDLVTNICECKSFTSKLFLKLLGAYKNFGWSNLEKKLYIRNKNDFKESIESVLKWNFEKIIMAHGQPILKDGHLTFKNAFKQ